MAEQDADNDGGDDLCIEGLVEGSFSLGLS